MRPRLSPLLILTLTASVLGGCDGCNGERQLSAEDREKLLVSALAASAPKPPTTDEPPPAPSAAGIGHAVNVISGQGPRRIENKGRSGIAFPIVPGQGVGPIRFGAKKATIERLMGAPCDDSTETLCRYVARGVDFTLKDDAVTEMRISRKGREAKRDAAGDIVEYGFFNGAIPPDLYFGMLPPAVQQYLGQPQKVEKITPMGPDGFSERHVYDGITLEYDAWSTGSLVLGAAVLTKSPTAAAASEKAEAERAKKAAESVTPLPKDAEIRNRPPR
jgi:hypothetical protein